MQDLIKALIKAKQSFSKIVKNTNAYNYKYAQLDQVIDAIEPALLENGLVFIQKPYDDQDKVGVMTTLFHESGQEISSIFVTPLWKKDCQAVGSQLTYYRRYALLAMFGLSPEDDDGAGAMPQKNQSSVATDYKRESLKKEVFEKLGIICKGMSTNDKEEYFNVIFGTKKYSILESMPIQKIEEKLSMLKSQISNGKL